MHAGIVLPCHGDAMCGVLAAESERIRHKLWSNLFKSNEANPSHRVAALKFRTKWRRELSLNYRRVNAVVDEKTATDQTMDVRHSHRVVVNRGARQPISGAPLHMLDTPLSFVPSKLDVKIWIKCLQAANPRFTQSCS
jgi:hypothetical protein